MTAAPEPVPGSIAHLTDEEMAAAAERARLECEAQGVPFKLPPASEGHRRLVAIARGNRARAAEAKAKGAR